jgi:hypothetical protein
MVVQRGWARGFAKRKIPKPTSTAAAVTLRARGSATIPAPTTSRATAARASSCPTAIGGRARSTEPRSRSCIPSPTANSQPIAGLSPWYAPSSASVARGTASTVYDGFGKQYESEEASPPWRRSWCGRSPSGNSTNRSGSSVSEPSSPASSLTSQPLIPSG